MIRLLQALDLIVTNWQRKNTYW